MYRMINNNNKTGYFLKSLLITELGCRIIEGVEEREELRIASGEDNHEGDVRRSSSERLLHRCSPTATSVFFFLSLTGWEGARDDPNHLFSNG